MLRRYWRRRSPHICGSFRERVGNGVFFVALFLLLLCRLEQWNDSKNPRTGQYYDVKGCFVSAMWTSYNRTIGLSRNQMIVDRGK